MNSQTPRRQLLRRSPRDWRVLAAQHWPLYDGDRPELSLRRAELVHVAGGYGHLNLSHFGQL